jgi:uncharacterized protein (TIGR00255 family)
MILSMTGFGRGRSVDRSKNVVEVELKSVNHRFFEISPRLPSDLSFLEGRVTSHIRKKVARGKLFLTVIYQRGEYHDLILNEPLLKRYHLLIKTAGKKLGVKEEVRLNHLLSLPEIFIRHGNSNGSFSQWEVMRRALDQAVAGLLKTREQEGKALGKELNSRLTKIEQTVEKIAARDPRSIEEYKESLTRKMEELSQGTSLDPHRLQMEVALYMKNCDITEEIVRLRSHLDHFRNSLSSQEEMGRKLDFIAQELQREANTIGSKASDAMIARWVILVKSEIDKIREQVQNIE